MGAGAEDPAARHPVPIRYLGMGKSEAVAGTGADDHHRRPDSGDQARRTGCSRAVVGGKENRAGKVPAGTPHQLVFRPGLGVTGEQKGGLSKGRLDDQ